MPDNSPNASAGSHWRCANLTGLGARLPAAFSMSRSLTLALVLTLSPAWDVDVRMGMQAALLDAAARDATEARPRERERRAGLPRPADYLLLNSYDSLHVQLLTSAYECYRGNLASAHRSIVTAPYDAQVYRYATSLLECQLARCGLAIKHAPWPRAPGAAVLPAGARSGLSGAVVGARVSLPSTAANAAAMGLLDG